MNIKKVVFIAALFAGGICVSEIEEISIDPIIECLAMNNQLLANNQLLTEENQRLIEDNQRLTEDNQRLMEKVTFLEDENGSFEEEINFCRLQLDHVMQLKDTEDID